eukprot:1381501-Amorphochlora_amoeboformis.AAC.2
MRYTERDGYIEREEREAYVNKIQIFISPLKYFTEAPRRIEWFADIVALLRPRPRLSDSAKGIRCPEDCSVQTDIRAYISVQ